MTRCGIASRSLTMAAKPIGEIAFSSYVRASAIGTAFVEPSGTFNGSKRIETLLSRNAIDAVFQVQRTMTWELHCSPAPRHSQAEVVRFWVDRCTNFIPSRYRLVSGPYAFTVSLIRSFAMTRVRMLLTLCLNPAQDDIPRNRPPSEHSDSDGEQRSRGRPGIVIHDGGSKQPLRIPKVVDARPIDVNSDSERSGGKGKSISSSSVYSLSLSCRQFQRTCAKTRETLIKQRLGKGPAEPMPHHPDPRKRPPPKNQHADQDSGRPQGSSGESGGSGTSASSASSSVNSKTTSTSAQGQDQESSRPSSSEQPSSSSAASTESSAATSTSSTAKSSSPAPTSKPPSSAAKAASAENWTDKPISELNKQGSHYSQVISTMKSIGFGAIPRNQQEYKSRMNSGGTGPGGKPLPPRPGGLAILPGARVPPIEPP